MKLVVIDWIDAHSHSGSGWKRLDDLEDQNFGLRVRSVGWLVADGEALVIVPHISGQAHEGMTPFGKGEISIPATSVLKMRTLRG